MILLVPTIAFALPSCPDTITYCCTLDQSHIYHIGSDIHADDTCLVISTPDPYNAVWLYGDGHTITGKIVGTSSGVLISYNQYADGNAPIKIENLRITNFTVGIMFDGLNDYVYVSNNYLYDNRYGIYISAPSNYNKIFSNIFNNSFLDINDQIGNNNNIFYNNFFNGAVDATSDFWNIAKTSGPNIIGGPWIGGNYWSDYTGQDTNGDGLGDTSTPFNNDNLPLVDINASTYSNIQTDNPSAYSTQPTWMNVTWTDNIGVSNVLIERNYSDTPTNYTPSQAGSVYYLSSVLPAGTFYWKSYASDARGNWNSTTNSIFTINKAASSVDLLLNNSDSDIPVEAGSTANITAVLTSGGSDIYLYQDYLQINGGTSPLTNLTTYNSVGAYNITVIYPGDENYTSSSETHFITVQDTTPPQWSNPRPQGLIPYNPSNYTSNITWTDSGSGVDEVILTMDGTIYSSKSSPSYIVKNGDTYSMTFSNCQSSGGGGGGRIPFLMSVGPIIPILFLISIFSSLVVRIKKKYNILSVIFIALVINLFFVSLSGADATSPCLATGNHNYRWYAKDASGNGVYTGYYTFFIGIDPVSIYIISPKNTTYSTNSVDVKYSVSSPFEISWIGYSLDNKPSTTLTGNTSLNIVEGSHNMIFYANTTLGVMNSSQRVYFTVSLPKPDLTIQDISTAGSTISYSIKNQGNANAGSSYSNLWVDGTYVTNDYLSSLTAGSSSNRAFSYGWTCSGTSDTIKVCADANGNVVESDETNNCLTKTFTCPAPATCTCTAWVNTYNLCTGMVNGCYYKYTRTCSPSGCGQQSQCVYGGKYCAV